MALAKSADLGGGRRPAGIGEPEVHEDHRGLLAGRHHGGLVAPPGDADHGQVVLVFQDPGDGRGEERVVLDDQHSHWVRWGYAQRWLRDTGNSELKREGKQRICPHSIPQ